MELCQNRIQSKPLKTRPVLFSDLFTALVSSSPSSSECLLPLIFAVCAASQAGGKVTNASYSWHFLPGCSEEESSEGFFYQIVCLSAVSWSKRNVKNEFLRWRVVCLCRNVSITAHSLFKNHALPLVFVAQVDILASVSLVVVLWQSSQHIQVREDLS